MNNKITAGFAQFSPQFGDPDATIGILGKLFSANDLPNILVLPELSNSGYNFDSAKEAFQFSESIRQSRYVEFLTEISRKKNVLIVTGFNEKDGEKIYNSALLISPKGILGKYRKIHLFMNEKDYFTPGDLGFPVFQTEFGTLGMLVCFDYIFPESWRVLGLKGTSIVCHPSNLVTPYAQRVVPPQGIINRFFIVTCNRTGTERDLIFTGQSFISDPEGNILYMASPGETGLHYETLDIRLAENKMITPRNHVFDDRRPEHYSDLVC